MGWNIGWSATGDVLGTDLVLTFGGAPQEGSLLIFLPLFNAGCGLLDGWEPWYALNLGNQAQYRISDGTETVLTIPDTGTEMRGVYIELVPDFTDTVGDVVGGSAGPLTGGGSAFFGDGTATLSAVPDGDLTTIVHIGFVGATDPFSGISLDFGSNMSAFQYTIGGDYQLFIAYAPEGVGPPDTTDIVVDITPGDTVTNMYHAAKTFAPVIPADEPAPRTIELRLKKVREGVPPFSIPTRIPDARRR